MQNPNIFYIISSSSYTKIIIIQFIIISYILIYLLEKYFSFYFIDPVVSYTWTKAKDGNLPKGYFGYFPPNTHNSIQFCRVHDNVNVRYDMYYYVYPGYIEK